MLKKDLISVKFADLEFRHLAPSSPLLSPLFKNSNSNLDRLAAAGERRESRGKREKSGKRNCR